MKRIYNYSIVKYTRKEKRKKSRENLTHIYAPTQFNFLNE